MALLKSVGKKLAEKATQGALASVAKKAPRMSEALNPHVGKRLYITQADRTALDYDQGLLGGPGYVELAGIDPKYKDIAWAVQSPGVAKTLVGSMARNPEEAVFANLIGSPEQHRSNKVVFDRIMDRFEKAVQEDKLTPELHQTINKRLANMKDPKTGKSFFPEDVDILSPEFNQHAQTFHQRAYIADILAGKGVGGKKGSIIDYPQVIKETTDPLLLEAKTGDIGDRLFSLSGNIQERPELHPAFHYSLSGKKESEAFAPAPQGIVLKNFTKDFTERTGRLPTYYDLTRGYSPSEKITDEMLERMYKEGYAGGGLAKKIAKKLAQELPEASASGKTPIATTVGTYRKASPILLEDIKDVNAPILDYGAGMGLGAEELRKTFLNVKTLEPFYEGKFDFTDPSKVPSGEFKGLTNFSVLNAVTPEVRDSIVENIGRVMDRGGVGLITARSPSAVMSTKGKLVDEPNAMITQKGTYQKGFDTDELREYIKYILGSNFEYEPLKGLSGTSVKVKKKAEGGTISDDAEEYGEQLKEQRKTLGSDILKTGRRGITEGIGNILQSAKETLSRAGTIGDIVEGYGKYAAPIEKARYEGITGKKIPQFKPVPYLPDQSITESPVDAKILPLTTGEQQFAGEVLGDPLSYSVTGAGRGIKKVGKFLAEGLAEAEATGRGPVGKVMQTIVPRFNVIKDQGGMLVGGEKDLDEVLLHMKKTETPRYSGGENGTFSVDPNALTLNSWIDTKVRKYIRNQAGSEADPIRKLVDKGVPYGFTETSGESKYIQGVKRKRVGKPTEGISQTSEGKNWEYTVDSIFSPTQSNDIKEILRNPNISEAQKKSRLRVELDLPIIKDEDFEAIKLINEISDKNVYDLNPTGLTQKLGLNHVSDVLYEDLMSGKLTPEQLNQMSIEKAIRRTAEYDLEKAKAMAKANASSVEGMPIPKEYDDGYKWVELKHDTDPKRTEKALKSEGEMMGHCVGGYCPDVESGEIKIFSLRGPDGKSHVTIEARPQFSMTLWRNANMDAINSNPKLKEYDFNMRSLDDDNKYGRQMTERDYVREMTKEMKKLGINPVEPPSYMELHQVKGKQNKRPDDKYQSYISDFIKNNPSKHEIVDVYELDNTNLMGVQNLADSGFVSKDIHFHPEVTKALKIKYPPFDNLMSGDKEYMTYNLFREVARDFARQNKNYVDKDDILNHIREKYLTPLKKAKGGSIDLQQEYKLENMRRRYG